LIIYSKLITNPQFMPGNGTLYTWDRDFLKYGPRGLAKSTKQFV
jgi:hypothetical protein